MQEVVVIFVMRGTRLLLLQRGHMVPSIANMWCLPGGSVEPGEAPLDAAERELHEETGIDFVPIGVGRYRLQYVDTKIITSNTEPRRELKVHSFWGRVGEDQPGAVKLEKGFSGFGWFDPDKDTPWDNVMQPVDAMFQHRQYLWLQGYTDSTYNMLRFAE